jgi:hypothetical protein
VKLIADRITAEPIVVPFPRMASFLDPLTFFIMTTSHDRESVTVDDASVTMLFEQRLADLDCVSRIRPLSLLKTRFGQRD